MKLRPCKRYVAIVAALCLLSVGMSGCISQAGYEFKGGITPPKVVSDLMKNGTVVLFITQNNCPACEEALPKLMDLQKQYNGTNVTFATFNVDNSTTSRNVGQVYGASATPTTVVLRKDGAAAVFVGVFDENTVKSAIEDARK
ncbi:MAG: TlpA family protein disulfide reductase [Halobacteriota archaeon]